MDTEKYDNPPSGFQTLTRPEAEEPKTRYSSALVVQNDLRQLVDNDRQKRSWKRKEISGLCDGNPPYSHAKLKKAGRLDVTNVNWLTARSFCEDGAGRFYDLFSEAPTNFLVKTGFGNADDQDDWSNQITQIAHDTLNDDPRWQFIWLNSQWSMVLHGCGPLYFETPNTVMPRSIRAADLVVPENAESTTAYWERAFILIDYKPHELYGHIKDPVVAHKLGWDVKYTRWAIMNAMSSGQQPSIARDFEYFQRLLKSNSSTSFDQSLIIRVALSLWREFDKEDTITQGIIEQETSGGSPYLNELGLNDSDKDQAVRYLFLKTGRYKNWCEVIHPMWFDRGNGYHYTVNGMGLSMFHALNIANRLRCNLVDKAMAPKIMFKPTSESHPEFVTTQLGDYGQMPAGWDVQQIGIAGVMQDGLVMLNEVEHSLTNNIAAYRQGWNKSQGNPPTLGQVQIEQAQQYRVANTQISRYYRQLDDLYKEIIKRLCSKSVSDPLAIKFRKECKDAGIPDEALGKIVHVEASRVTGQGSSLLRQQALDKLLAMSGRFPEAGQDAVWMDWIAATSGTRNSVQRYWPGRKKELVGTEQQAEAMLQIAAMKIGVAPIITGEQDPLVFATLFLNAAQQALQSVAQGANPIEVIKFVDMAAPAAHAHAQRMLNDPMRKTQVKQIEKGVQQIAAAVDQLKQKIAQAQQQQAQQQQQTGPQIPPEEQQQMIIDAAKAKQAMQAKEMSHQQRMVQRDQAHQMKMAQEMRKAQVDTASKDLETAANIRRKGLETLP